jgi:hypothetical protein
VHPYNHLTDVGLRKNILPLNKSPMPKFEVKISCIVMQCVSNVRLQPAEANELNPSWIDAKPIFINKQPDFVRTKF